MHQADRFTHASRCALLLAFVVALVAPDARAGDPPVFGYGVVFNNATQVYDFVTFPLVTPLAPLDGQVVAATAAGSNYAHLYAIDADANLVTVDTATGDASIIGSLGIEPQQRVSIAVDPGTGLMYLIVGDSNCLFTLLYTVDTSTGLATPVAPLPECVASVAADVAHQLLYFLDQGAGALNVVDIDGNERFNQSDIKSFVKNLNATTSLHGGLLSTFSSSSSFTATPEPASIWTAISSLPLLLAEEPVAGVVAECVGGLEYVPVEVDAGQLLRVTGDVVPPGERLGGSENCKCGHQDDGREPAVIHCCSCR